MDRAARRLLGILGFFVFVFLYGAGAEFYRDIIKPNFSPSPTAVPPTPFPTLVIYPTINAPPTSSCLLWSQVTKQMEGQTVCVYGTVVEHRENWENFITNIYFGTREDFYIVSNYRWDESQVGQCLTATGKIQLNTYKIPYIKIDDQIINCQ